MSTKPAKKVLRVGLIQDGRIIEERLMRSTKPVTIGHGINSNTLVVPASKLPKSVTLFEPKGSGYLLHFSEKMAGRVSLGDGVYTLQELVRQGKAQKSGGKYVLQLNQRARGKLSFGDVTILFQFVTPPRRRPAPVLPASMRGGWFKGTEPFLIAVVAISAILQIGFVIWVETNDWPEQLDAANADIPDRFVKVLAEPDPEDLDLPEDESEPEENDDEGESEAEADEAQTQPQPQDDGDDQEEDAEPAENDEERRKRMAEKVKKSTILHEIGAVAGEDGNLADTLAAGADSTSMDEAFEGSTGMKTAEVGGEKSGVRSGGSSDAEGSGSAAGIDDLGQTSGAKAAEEGVNTGSKEEETVKAKVDIEDSGPTAGSGTLDNSRISRVVRRGASGVQRCFERVLKQNPDANGKLVVTVTIGQAGRVTNVDTNTSIGKDFETCAKNRIKSWRFPRPKGGDVMFNKTFVLTK